MVSTDDAEIAEIAAKYGAKIPFMRSNEKASDFATTFEVVQEVIDSYATKFKYACCVYPCNPFLTTENLSNAFEVLTKNKKNTVFPVIEYSHPIQRALQINNNDISFAQPEFALTRSQDLPKRYHDAGQFYFFNVEKVMEEQRIIGDSTGAIIISEMDAQDIDNESDWKLAELKYQLKNGISK